MRMTVAVMRKADGLCDIAKGQPVGGSFAGGGVSVDEKEWESVELVGL